MENITKMRIIHSVYSNSEKEYLKSFFNYVGILVYDEAIFYNDSINEWARHLNQKNDTDGVDVVLNYYGEDFSFLHSKRIYLYFDLDKNICEILPSPLSSSIQLTNKENANMSKRQIRIEALNLLINEIWKNNERDRIAVQQIKECYAPQNEDRDLFYILQTLCCINVFDLDVIKETEKEYDIPTKLFLNDYIKKMLIELWRMQCLLQYDTNPYAIYTKINNSKLLSRLYFYLADVHKSELRNIEYDGAYLKLNSYGTLSDQTYDLLREYPWFIKAYFELIEFNEIRGYNNDDIYNYLLNISEKSLFPAYFSPIYNIIGQKELIKDFNNYQEKSYYNEQAKKRLEECLQIDPQNYKASYFMGCLEASEGKFKIAESILRETQNFLILYNVNEENPYFLNFASFYDLINAFQSSILLSKIAINSNREYTAKAYVTYAILYSEGFENALLVRKIADKNEKAYQDFILSHEYSVPVYDLYFYLRPWVENIINDEITKDVIQRKLDKWK